MKMNVLMLLLKWKGMGWDKIMVCLNNYLFKYIYIYLGFFFCKKFVFILLLIKLK